MNTQLSAPSRQIYQGCQPRVFLRFPSVRCQELSQVHSILPQGPKFRKQDRFALQEPSDSADRLFLTLKSSLLLFLLRQSLRLVLPEAASFCGLLQATVVFQGLSDAW